MTLVVNRDGDGNVSISYTEGGASVQLRGEAGSGVTFTDAYSAPDVDKVAAPAAAVLAAAPPLEPETVEPDNALPFKCPACGATFAEQGVCTNQHPAEPTLPTEAVLAGAATASDDAADVTKDVAPAEAAASTSELTAGGDGAVVPPAPPQWPS
jgi:hypothetical protein